MRLTGVGPAGPRYYVRVTMRLRIRAPRQRMTAVFEEQMRLGWLPLAVSEVEAA